MAAHILRMLSEVEQGKVPVAQFVHALAYAPACDQLDYDHWERLNKAAGGANLEDLRQEVRNVLPYYVAKFFELDCPRNNEEWGTRKYARGAGDPARP